MNYEGSLQNALDNLFYRNRSRDTISSGDEDVLRIFSGDERAARLGILAFLDRHKDACWLVGEAKPHVVVKVSGLFTDPEQRILREKYVSGKRRFRQGRFPEQRAYRRGRR